MAEEHYDDYAKWFRRAYEQRYGKGSWDQELAKKGAVK